MRSGRLRIALVSLLLLSLSLLPLYFENSLHPGEQHKRATDGTNDIAKVCSKDVAPSLENVENFDWTYCSFDLQPFWASLTITETEFTDSSSLSEAVSVFGDLDRDGTDERILRLTLRTSADEKIRFVVLKAQRSQNSIRWRTL